MAVIVSFFLSTLACHIVKRNIPPFWGHHETRPLPLKFRPTENMQMKAWMEVEIVHQA